MIAPEHWTVAATNNTAGRGRPVEMKIDRGLTSGRLDFVPLTDDEAIELATALLVAASLSKRCPA